MPADVDPVAVERIVGEVPEALVDLALWLAEYYGSTPARALALVAPAAPARRKGAAAARRARAARRGRAARADRRAAGRAAADHARPWTQGGGSLLLFGATGSGKTEVYLRACAEALARGQGAIVLVPEIALTPQAAGRFRARFGDQVAVLHSGLSDAERRDERERIAGGEARVVVGARSAVFAPVRDLGLICVDEEQDPSYKHESDPRYDARTVAVKRAALEGRSPCSAARRRARRAGPRSSVSSSADDSRGRPPACVVDMRREAGYPLSAPLLEELGCCRGQGRQGDPPPEPARRRARRTCRGCGSTFRCEQCDVALTLHADGQLHCHHCGFQQPAPELCPSLRLCRSSPGSARDSERLESELAKQLPELELFPSRCRRGLTPRRAGQTALTRFAAADRAVLLGTQMVAEGPSLRRRGARRGRRRGHGHGAAGLPLGRADLPAHHPARRPERPRRARPSTGADLPAGLAPGRARRRAMASRSSCRESSSGAACSATRRSAISCGSWSPGPARAGRRPSSTEIRAQLEGMPDADLLGPAPLIRLRGRHRAQLLAKTGFAPPLASKAARLLAAAAPAMRRDGLAASVDVDPQTLL